jgi:hypothetical protein
MKLCINCIELDCQLTFIITIIIIGADEVSSSKTVIYFGSVKRAIFCEIR